MNKISLVKLIGLSAAIIIFAAFPAVSFGQKNPAKKSTSKTGVSDADIGRGLKEALSKGVKFAVDGLGKENGFLENVDVKIPVPKSLNNIEKALRSDGRYQRDVY